MNPGLVPAESRLLSIAMAYENKSMIADKVFPRVSVPSMEFRWAEYDLSSYLSVPETKVGRKSRPNEVEFPVTEKPGMVNDYALDDVVPLQDIERAGKTYDPKGIAVEGITALLTLDREIRAARLALDPANYSASNQVIVTQKWDDPASNPIEQIATYLDTLFVRPNVLLFPKLVWSKVRKHPKVVAAVSATGKTEGMVTAAQLADILEIDEIIIGEGFLNSAKPGQQPVVSRIWGTDSVLAFYRGNVSSTTKGLTFGITAQYEARKVLQIAEPNLGARGSIRYRVYESLAELPMARDLAFLFSDVLTT